MKVFTYFDPAIPSEANQTGVLREWAASWSRWGWKPRVLTPVLAFQHPGARDYFDHVSRFPNPRAYMRWLALEKAGGGWLTGYDVINRGFKPRRGVGPVEMITPCVVWASKSGAPTITHLIRNFNPRSLAHVSERLIFNRIEGALGVGCVEFRSPGWERAPLVHFSSGRCARFPDKLTAIRSAEPYHA